MTDNQITFTEEDIVEQYKAIGLLPPDGVYYDETHLYQIIYIYGDWYRYEHWIPYEFAKVTPYLNGYTITDTQVIYHFGYNSYIYKARNLKESEIKRLKYELSLVVKDYKSPVPSYGRFE